MECYYFDNFLNEVIDDDEIDWDVAPPERYTLARCYKGEDFDDVITEIWCTSDGLEKVRYLVMDKYQTNPVIERKKQLKGKQLFLKEVILPYSFFYRWYM